ncbi:hypothetical protein POTOM_004026 [Populus tomentosa]|uniref:Uncharacterized protein n=1 Tax=Populus tomentosa TaxID=118781 RepID=A0A8X8AUX6_POPTO|nr:hypothetical protein POTOM_004026 [Populus tomentosa]
MQLWQQDNEGKCRLLVHAREINEVTTRVSAIVAHLRRSEFLDYTLPVSVAAGFPLSASFPVESKRHSSEKLKLYNARFMEQAGVLSYEQGVSEAPNSGSFWWSFVSECYLGNTEAVITRHTCIPCPGETSPTPASVASETK